MNQERYAGMMRLLRDQDALANLPEPTVIHEPHVIIGNPELLTTGIGTRIDSFCKIEIGQGVHIGKFVHIASFAHIGIGGGLTVIEDYAAVASGCKVISGSNDVDAFSMSAVAPSIAMRIEKKHVSLKKFAVVLTNAVVLPGVTLHEGAVLAAGSVAVHDIPEWEIWGGVPAKFIRHRKVR